MENEPKLKPCPFCGGEAKKNMAKTEAGELKYYISCQKCYARSRSFTQNEEAAVKAWNRRNGSQTYDIDPCAADSERTADCKMSEQSRLEQGGTCSAWGDCDAWDSCTVVGVR